MKKRVMSRPGIEECEDIGIPRNESWFLATGWLNLSHCSRSIRTTSTIAVVLLALLVDAAPASATMMLTSPTRPQGSVTRDEGPGRIAKYEIQISQVEPGAGVSDLLDRLLDLENTRSGIQIQRSTAPPEQARTAQRSIDDLVQLIAKIEDQATSTAAANRPRAETAALLIATARAPSTADSTDSMARAAVGHLEDEDRTSRYLSALALSGAIDEILPLLIEQANELESSINDRDEHSSVGGESGCDLIDQTPFLCIGGSDQNHYSKDAALLIDLGGDDLYTNSAGGADAGADGRGLPVSVNLDLSGDDRYLADVGGLDARIVQGAGADGGIGILVDVAGDDSYAIKVRSSGFEQGSLGVVGQGAGIGGVGILADLQGDDSYSARSDRSALNYGVVAQGATVGGAGALMDVVGDDAYLLDSRPSRWDSVVRADDWVHLPPASVHGLGAAVDGAALLIDAGGSDDLALRAVLDEKVVSRYAAGLRPGSKVTPQGSLAVGFGAATTGGAAVAVFGDGATSKVVEADGGGVVVAYGASSGGLGGYGALRDAGGDDRYHATGSGQLLVAMAASWRGIGVLEDEKGNDHYYTQFDFEPQRHDFHLLFIGGVFTQGAGLFGGEGELTDADGNDSYRVRATGSGAVAQGASWALRPVLIGQLPISETRGLLRDLGGQDSYWAHSSELYRSANSLRGTEQSVQGSVEAGVALLIDRDDDQQDDFFSRPADPACEGERGGPSWRDCGDGRGEGRTKL